MIQASLFPADFPRFAEGFHYAPDFLSAADEASLLNTLEALPFAAAAYKQFRARRRVVSYGGRFDYDANTLEATAPIPEFLHPLRARAAQWAGLPADSFQQALIAEYSKGTPLGWHRDVPQFEVVVGVSLLSPCRMRFRRYPPRVREKSLVLELAPRSIYRLEGEARWGWQHSVPAVDSLRYSITFRTLRVAGKD